MFDDRLESALENFRTEIERYIESEVDRRYEALLHQSPEQRLIDEKTDREVAVPISQQSKPMTDREVVRFLNTTNGYFQPLIEEKWHGKAWDILKLIKSRKNPVFD